MGTIITANKVSNTVMDIIGTNKNIKYKSYVYEQW